MSTFLKSSFNPTFEFFNAERCKSWSADLKLLQLANYHSVFVCVKSIYRNPRISRVNDP